MAGTIYREIARLRFRGYEITGEGGPSAAVLDCCRRVVLASMPMEAHAIAAESCGATCQLEDWSQVHHRIVELDEPRARRRITNHPDREP